MDDSREQRADKKRPGEGVAGAEGLQESRERLAVGSGHGQVENAFVSWIGWKAVDCGFS
jgi:hypothetical protein